jgi:hypothetical protein
MKSKCDDAGADGASGNRFKHSEQTEVSGDVFPATKEVPGLERIA